MPEVNEDTYLGDILSSDDKNSKNISLNKVNMLKIVNCLFIKFCFSQAGNILAMYCRFLHVVVNGCTTLNEQSSNLNTMEGINLAVKGPISK